MISVVVKSAVAMGKHPYDVINFLAAQLPREKRKEFCESLRSALLAISHTLPWSF